jgi:hypothetical protein
MSDRSKNFREIDDLIFGHFDHSLTEQQECELAHHLKTCPETQARFCTQMRMEGKLHSLGRDGFLSPPAHQLPSEAEASESDKMHEVTQASNVSHKRSIPTVITSWVVAATAILLLTSWSLWPSGVSAASVLEQAKQAAQKMVDRTYRVTLINPQDQTVEQELRLDMRGASQFVIRPLDGSYIMGSNGSEFWITRPNESVWVTSNFRSLAPALRRRIPNRRILGFATSPNEPLLLEISGLIALIERNYEIELVNSPESPEHHIRATLRSAKPNVPQSIELWADPETGVVGKAVTHWPNQSSRALELVKSEPLHEDWLQHSHHAPNAEVIDL